MSVLRGKVLSRVGCVFITMFIASFIPSGSWGESDSATRGNDELPLADPVNLQVLPKDLSRDGLRQLMKSYSRDLGVTCRHCHLEDSQTQTMDYASDDKPAKQTARVMIAMMGDINGKYLGRLNRDPRYSVPVTCGRTVPRTRGPFVTTKSPSNSAA